MVRRIKAPWGLDRRPIVHKFLGECEGRFCEPGNHQEIQWYPSMTAYHQEEGEPDPNPDRKFCEKCWEDYREHWQEMWDDYYGGLI